MNLFNPTTNKIFTYMSLFFLHVVLLYYLFELLDEFTYGFLIPCRVRVWYKIYTQLLVWV